MCKARSVRVERAFLGWRRGEHSGDDGSLVLAEETERVLKATHGGLVDPAKTHATKRPFIAGHSSRAVVCDKRAVR